MRVEGRRFALPIRGVFNHLPEANEVIRWELFKKPLDFANGKGPNPSGVEPCIRIKAGSWVSPTDSLTCHADRIRNVFRIRFVSRPACDAELRVWSVLGWTCQND